jgi:hypothetical protein
LQAIRNKWNNFLRRIGYSKEEKLSVPMTETSTAQTTQLQKIIEPLDFPYPVETPLQYQQETKPKKPYQAQLISSKNEPKTKLHRKCQLIFSYTHQLPPFVKLRIIGNRVYAYKEVGDYIMRSEDGNFYAFPSMKVGVEISTDEEGKLMIGSRVGSEGDEYCYPLVLGKYEGPHDTNGRDHSQQNFTDVGCINRFPDLIDEIEREDNPLKRIDEALIAIEGFLTVVDPSEIYESQCVGFEKLTEDETKKSGKPITNINIIKT